MTADLAAWLTQILDEDQAEAEVAAKEHTGPEWIMSEDVVGANGGYVACGAYGGDIGAEIGRFIVAHDPAAVLADIAAKRAIIDEHHNEYKGRSADGLRATCARCGMPGEYNVSWPCPTLRLLASAYAERPGYREEWKP